MPRLLSDFDIAQLELRALLDAELDAQIAAARDAAMEDELSPEQEAVRAQLRMKQKCALN